MRVFLSWSGERSKSLAEAFKKWLPAVLQAARPYFSPADIEKGSRWASEIAKELENSKYGLIFLTPENVEAPWVMFEAGALSKSLDKSRVTPLLFGMEPADIKGPLVQFQAATFNKDSVLACVKGINAGLESPLQSEVLESVFTKWWPDLEKEVATIVSAGSKRADKKQIRGDRELLEEVLEISRALHQRVGASALPMSSRAVRDIAEGFISLVGGLEQENLSDENRRNLLEMHAPLRYLLNRSGGDPQKRVTLTSELKRTADICAKPQESSDAGGPDDIPF